MCATMPISCTATAAEYVRACITCQAYFRATPPGTAPEGVWLLADSGGGNDPGCWDVWFLPGARADDELPYTTMPAGTAADRISSLPRWDPTARSCTSIREYVELWPAGVWHRQLAGYSSRYLTRDGLWFAVDLYHQPPSLLHNTQCMWSSYVLLDCRDPLLHWMAPSSRATGMQQLPVDDPWLPLVLLAGDATERIAEEALYRINTPARAAPESIEEDPVDPPGIEDHRVYPLRPW